MRQVFEKEETEAILLVDAENAFNNLNRKAALHNIKELCPPFYRYLNNTYGLPAKMIVNDQEKIDIILSEEGSTQGDVTAMGMYAIGTRPLIDILADQTDPSKCQQVWYTDDSSAWGKLKPSKSWLIVKEQYSQYAAEVFAGTGIQITTEGHRHLGAVIGSPTFKDKYVTEKIDGWIDELKVLEKIAKVEPHVALERLQNPPHYFSYIVD